MIEVKNQFARHGLFWLWVLPLALFLLVPAMLEREAMRVPRQEIQMLSLLGQDAGAVTERADALYQSVFVETRLVESSRKLFLSEIWQGARRPTMRTCGIWFTARYGAWPGCGRSCWP